MSIDQIIESDEFQSILRDANFILRLGTRTRTLSEKLQLLILKLLILLWEEGQEESLQIMEEKLELIDDIRHELTFLRAKYYKEVFNKRAEF